MRNPARQFLFAAIDGHNIAFRPVSFRPDNPDRKQTGTFVENRVATAGIDKNFPADPRADDNLAALQLRMHRVGAEKCPDRLPVQNAIQHLRRVAPRNDHINPGPHANFRREKFRVHPARAALRPRPFRETNQIARKMRHLRKQFRVLVRRRIFVVKPFHIRKQNQKIRIRNARDRRRQRVVVANLQLVGRHRVILIDDRNRARFQKRANHAACVHIAPGIQRIALRQQHLPHMAPVILKRTLVRIHQNALPDRRRRLFLAQKRRPLGESQERKPDPNRAGRHQHHLPPVIHQVANLPRQMIDETEFDFPVRMRDRARPHLDDNRFFAGNRFLPRAILGAHNAISPPFAEREHNACR